MARFRIRDIEAAVCRHFNILPEDLQRRSRARRIVRPRQIAMFLSRELTDQSLAQIGRHFDRDHSTVLEAIRRITQIQSERPKLAAHVAGCRALIATALPARSIGEILEQHLDEIIGPQAAARYRSEV